MDPLRTHLRLVAAAVLGTALALGAGLAIGQHSATAQSPATLTLAPSTSVTAPGRCVQATVTISPDKTGQTVALQEFGADGWTTVASGTLGPGSTVTVPLCFGWANLGAVPVRASWNTDGQDASGLSPAATITVRKAPWMLHVDALSAGRSMSVSVGESGVFVYRHADTTGRAPASDEKLLLSMTLLNRVGPGATILTRAAAANVQDGVVAGDLWIMGGADPAVTTGRIDTLAQHVRDAGITSITGRVMGSTGFLSHDWWAPGWKPSFPRTEVPLPTALAFNGNAVHGVHIGDPEYRAAAALTKRLRAIGVHVAGAPGAGLPSGQLQTVASITSAPMGELLQWVDVPSWNFGAETLGKLLGASRYGPPGTIAKGAAAIRGFAWARHVGVSAYDSSGLSYDDRISASGMVTLLRDAEDEPWFSSLRAALPHAGEGTLTGRLAGVRVRAKTGTLANVSALSGWVWVPSRSRWAEFSILSSGYTPILKHVEDEIVRTIAGQAG